MIQIVLPISLLGRARKGAVRSSRPQLAEADAVWERIYAASASLNGQPQYPAVGGQRTTWERIYNAEASCRGERPFTAERSC